MFSVLLSDTVIIDGENSHFSMVSEGFEKSWPPLTWALRWMMRLGAGF